MDQIEKIIRENCWRFDKGYPDSQEDINYLKTLIEQEVEDSLVPGDTSGEQQEKVADVIKDSDRNTLDFLKDKYKKHK